MLSRNKDRLVNTCFKDIVISHRYLLFKEHHYH
jgi:hypothetical protein